MKHPGNRRLAIFKRSEDLLTVKNAQRDHLVTCLENDIIIAVNID